MENATMIAIDGLQAFNDLLARLDFDAAENQALDEGTRALEEAIQEDSQEAPVAGLVHGWLPDGRAVIGSTDPQTLTQEVGAPGHPGTGAFGAAVRDAGALIAARFGEAFVRLLAGQ
jgi:hypothetical protein